MTKRAEGDVRPGSRGRAGGAQARDGLNAAREPRFARAPTPERGVDPTPTPSAPIFTRCEEDHPSRALVRFRFPRTDAAVLVVCTYRGKASKQSCGREYGVFER